jgi:nuclear pore complex protein Nup62
MWDSQLRENQRCLEDIVDNVHRVMAGQNDLRTACESIEAYQSDLENELINLSTDLELEIEKLQLQEPTESDCEREKTYVLAEDLNQNLNQMETNLKKVVSEFNKSKETSSSVSLAEESNPIGKIVEILNTHHDSLAWLDEKSSQLSRDIGLIKRDLQHIQ